MAVDNEQPPPRVYIKELDYTDKFYLGTDGSGGLVFRQNVFDYQNIGNQRYLNGSSLAALGLTEVCCRQGTGKVRAGHQAPLI